MNVPLAIPEFHLALLPLEFLGAGADLLLGALLRLQDLGTLGLELSRGLLLALRLEHTHTHTRVSQEVMERKKERPVGCAYVKRALSLELLFGVLALALELRRTLRRLGLGLFVTTFGRRTKNEERRTKVSRAWRAVYETTPRDLPGR